MHMLSCDLGGSLWLYLMNWFEDNLLVVSSSQPMLNKSWKWIWANFIWRNKMVIVWKLQHEECSKINNSAKIQRIWCRIGIPLVARQTYNSVFGLKYALSQQILNAILCKTSINSSHLVLTLAQKIFDHHATEMLDILRYNHINWKNCIIHYYDNQYMQV